MITITTLHITMSTMHACQQLWMGLNCVLFTAAVSSPALPPGQMDEHEKEPMKTHLIWWPYTYYGQEKDVVAYCDELRMCLRRGRTNQRRIYAACGWNIVLIEKLAPLIRTTFECKKACLVTSTTTNNTPLAVLKMEKFPDWPPVATRWWFPKSLDEEDKNRNLMWFLINKHGTRKYL